MQLQPGVDVRGQDRRGVPHESLRHLDNATLALDVLVVENLGASEARDIKMSDVQGFEVDFGSVVGMSGGPVVDQRNRAVGLLSFGLPVNTSVKSQTFAVSVSEIRAFIEKVNARGR